MIKTLAAGLQSESADFEILHKKYGPVLALVKELIGIVPNCDPILEIWPAGFRSYNLLVPNLFNLPGLIFGKKSFKTAVGLAMYTASKTAACAYCTAHSCSFALRRGADSDVIKGVRTAKEQAVVALAEGLSRIPANLTLADIRVAKEYFSTSEIEWLVLSISMMGFLNKFMNAMGIELEQDAINDTAAALSQTGWDPGKHVNGHYQITKAATPKQDNLLTYLRVIRQAPGAISLEKKWTLGVPGNYPAAAEYLRMHTGYSFPILKPVTPGRVVRAITKVLSDNLDKALTEVGLRIKILAGYVFTRVVSNDALSNEVKNMATHIIPGLDAEIYQLLNDIALWEIPTNLAECENVMTSLQQQLVLPEKEAAVMLLAIAAAPSPAQIDDAVIETVLTHVAPAGIVEIVVWLSVLQLLHRLNCYHTLIETF